MRRIAVINQKGGVGKTTTTANLGAALAQQGRRVVVVDMDAQANLSLSLNVEAPSDSPSAYTILTGQTAFARALRPTGVDGLRLVPSNIDLSGAELELASAFGREFLMRDALREWEADERASGGRAPADYVIFDCPPSLGLLSINALAASGEVLITLQTEFLALQGMSKLVEVVQLLRKRLNPELAVTGILPCLYDSRLKLAREVLGEIRAYFPGQVLQHPIRTNVKLAEAPSYGKTIFEYAPDSNGAQDYRWAAAEVIARESRDPDLAGLPPFRDVAAPPASAAAAGEVDLLAEEPARDVRERREHEAPRVSARRARVPSQATPQAQPPGPGPRPHAAGDGPRPAGESGPDLGTERTARRAGEASAHAPSDEARATVEVSAIARTADAAPRAPAAAAESASSVAASVAVVELPTAPLESAVAAEARTSSDETLCAEPLDVGPFEARPLDLRPLDVELLDVQAHGSDARATRSSEDEVRGLEASVPAASDLEPIRREPTELVPSLVTRSPAASEAPEPALREVVLAPPPRPEPPQAARLVLRAEDLPPLPPDAFEILSGTGFEA